MTNRTRALIVSILLPLALVACHRSEELGQLGNDAATLMNDDAAVLMNDDAHVDSSCQGGICFAPNGASCKNASQCMSGFCVDGVCCNTACLPSMTCFAAGSVGTCTATLPPPPRANGVGCTQASDCASGSCVGDVCCNTPCTDSAMTCSAPGSVGTCTATTTSQANGATCKQGSECTSGFCAGGVCCNIACQAACTTCVATGSVGTCTQTASCP